MEINQLQGSLAYSNAPDATVPIDNTATRDQNIEAAGTDLNTRATSVVQQAFEVDITQEARNRLAQEQNRQGEEIVEQQNLEPAEAQTAAPAEPAETPAQTQTPPPTERGSNPIVNIVA